MYYNTKAHSKQQPDRLSSNVEKVSISHTWARLCLPSPVSLTKRASLMAWLKTIIYLFVCVYVNVLVQVIVDARWFALVEANGGQIPPPLMDLGFEWLPRVPYHPIIGLTAPILTIVMICVLYLRTGYIFNNLLRQALVISATIFLLRAGTLHLTLLPPSLADCMEPKTLPNFVKTWPLWLRPFLVMSGQYTTCTDAFFSGHAANLTLNLFFWFYWVVVRSPSLPLRRLLTFAFLFAYGFSLFLIVASRFHYTIDVCIGIWVAWTVCYVYYYMLLG